MKLLITGGAGFIGTNAALYFGRRGANVTILDNLNRTGSLYNLQFIMNHIKDIRIVATDIRCRREIDSIIKNGKFDAILHLAGQVAVTTSVSDPRTDFEINAYGSLNILEAVRQYSPQTIVLYASTNKVYGAMDDIPIIEREMRYEYKDLQEGIGEDRKLDFHSPYGCSKGAADQYFIDYARIYGLKTIVFRQSCIYGSYQYGIEDQGWVAWFAIASKLKMPIKIYGTGKQLRDVLFVTDLIRAYESAIRAIRKTAGRVYNIGGGRFNISLLELIEYLNSQGCKPLSISFRSWRPGDQKVFISNNSKAHRDFGWYPLVGTKNGLARLIAWLEDNKSVIKRIHK